jgi:hypothetical protein
MDEVDGRSVPVAFQSGHLDAPADASMLSLSLPYPQSLLGAPSFALLAKGGKPQIPGFQVPFFRVPFFRTWESSKSPCTNSYDLGENHENVPGK